jgi:hypothetical protein
MTYQRSLNGSRVLDAAIIHSILPSGLMLHAGNIRVTGNLTVNDTSGKRSTKYINL